MVSVPRVCWVWEMTWAVSGEVLAKGNACCPPGPPDGEVTAASWETVLAVESDGAPEGRRVGLGLGGAGRGPVAGWLSLEGAGMEVVTAATVDAS